MYRYLIIIERGGQNLSAYVPDLPGCAATGATHDELLANMREAITLHLQGMIEDGERIPAPNSDPAYVEVAPPQAEP
ncbi:MAG TPA: type II toxin-antitoxin system HicB family antitoxin [Ktedonobacterales bacterium]|nr:type II toxin-antitoxin system HicB family antitoxin [Ktedonobacterales bacterium]